MAPDANAIKSRAYTQMEAAASSSTHIRKDPWCRLVAAEAVAMVRVRGIRGIQREQPPGRDYLVQRDVSASHKRPLTVNGLQDARFRMPVRILLQST
jgi:hypothetical protein